MPGSTTTTKRINLYQLSQEMSGAALRLVGTGDSTQPKTVKAPVATQAALDTAVAAHTFNAAIVPPPDVPLANQAVVAAALAQALADLDAVIAAAAVPATVGSLAQAQTAVRAIQIHVGNMALHLKRTIRYLTGDFTGTG